VVSRQKLIGWISEMPVLPGILFGLAFVAAVVGINRLLPTGQLRLAMLAILLAAAAAVYVGSSLGALPGSAAVQSAGLVLFGGVALRGLNSASILAAGWLGHSLWDLLHLTDILVAGTPPWYQVGCLIADPLLAGYLLYALGREVDA
jgi:hypothetical protein